MTDNEILIKLATGIMGWRYWDGRGDDSGAICTDAFVVGGLDVYAESGTYVRNWNPLERMSDTWMLTNALAAKGHECDTWRNSCIFSMPNRSFVSARGTTTPRAICIAALKVINAGT